MLILRVSNERVFKYFSCAFFQCRKKKFEKKNSKKKEFEYKSVEIKILSQRDACIFNYAYARELITMIIS